MTVSYGKGPKGKATRLHALLVRNRADGMCEAWLAHRNGKIDWHPECAGRIECSHVIPRRYNAVRTELDNALALCSGAHRHIAEFHQHHMELVAAVYGPGHWADLYARAQPAAKIDWVERVETLTRLAEQKGLL